MPRKADHRGKLDAWRAAAQQRVDATRQRSRQVDAAFVVGDRDRAVGGNLLACAIAYRVFLWLLPLALLITAGLGFSEAAGGGQTERIGGDLGIGKSVIAVVADAARQAERSRLPLLALALFGLYTAGGAGAKTLIAVHRFAWGMPPSRTKGGPLAALAFTGGAAVLVALAAGAQFVRHRSPGLGLTATAMVAVAYAAVWLAISILLPHGEAPWVRLVPGAVFVGIGTQLLHLVSVYYLSDKIHSASELYGGLGFAATLLLGLYLFARFVVAAAVLNAALWESSRGRRQSLAVGEAPEAVSADDGTHVERTTPCLDTRPFEPGRSS